MKTLRALIPFVFGELRTQNDICYAEAGEILVTPRLLCSKAKSDANCLCRRAFLGCHTGEPSTLAVVVDDITEDVIQEFEGSLVARSWWREGRALFSGAHMETIGQALESFQTGAVVRMRYSEDRIQIFPLEHLTEDEALAPLASGHTEFEAE